MLRAATDRRDLQLRCVLPNEPVPEQQADDGRVHRVVTPAAHPLAVLTLFDTTPRHRSGCWWRSWNGPALPSRSGGAGGAVGSAGGEVKGVPGPCRVPAGYDVGRGPLAHDVEATVFVALEAFAERGEVLGGPAAAVRGRLGGGGRPASGVHGDE